MNPPGGSWAPAQSIVYILYLIPPLVVVPDFFFDCLPVTEMNESSCIFTFVLCLLDSPTTWSILVLVEFPQVLMEFVYFSFDPFGFGRCCKM